MYETNGCLLNIETLGEENNFKLVFLTETNTSIGSQNCTSFLSPKQDNCSEIIACGYSPNLSPNPCREVASTTSLDNLSHSFVTHTSLESFLYNRKRTEATCSCMKSFQFNNSF